MDTEKSSHEGFLAALDRVPFSEVQVQTTGRSLRAVFEDAIARLVDPTAVAFDNPDDSSTMYNVRNRLIEIVDKHGFEHQDFTAYVAKVYWNGSIKMGFYKACKELSKQHSESRHTLR